MGTYTELTVAGYPVWTTKSEIDDLAMTIFRESDRRTFIRKVSDRNVLVWGEPSDTDFQTSESAVIYVASVQAVVERLDVMGFTLDRVRSEYETIRSARISDSRVSLEDSEGLDDRSERFVEVDGKTIRLPSHEELERDRLQLLESLNFDDYCDRLRHIVRNNLLPYRREDYRDLNLGPIADYILDENQDYPFGLMGSDVRSLIRLVCSFVDPKANVEQDITDLVDGEYYRPDEPVCFDAIHRLTSYRSEISNRIILTEGSTDREFIRDALGLLYPHLAEFYSFLDFDGSRSQGGAGHLVSMVKAFAGAGVTDHIIAIFDNDTAAWEARRSLVAIDLPSNMAVLAYPELEMLRAYPTMGPNGMSLQNINGLAASIELYLGADVLGNSSNLVAVQWKGFNTTLGRYHGEVLNKEQIHSAFREKMSLCKADRARIPEFDWSGLRAILESIFRAFHARKISLVAIQ
jgi:hypothetical protein